MLRRYSLRLIPVALLAGWLIRYLIEDELVPLQTANFALSGFAVLTLLGVAFGVRSAWASEARCKAQEDIWLNH